VHAELREKEQQVSERDAHVAELKKQLHAAQSEATETEQLRSVVAELQSVLREAMRAGTWQQCRQVLYHESLRYVQTAATHGKHGHTSASKGGDKSAPEKPGSARRPSAAHGHRRTSAHMADGAAIDRMVHSGGHDSSTGGGPDRAGGAALIARAQATLQQVDAHVRRADPA